MTKVNDFCLVAGLGLLVVGSTDKVLRVFKIGIKAKKEEDGEVGDVQLEMKGKINKESDSRTIQLTFDNKRSVMLVLSSDNNLEIFKVINSHKTDSILKKLVKREKKASLKRTFSEHEEQDDSLPIKKSVDKAKLIKLIEE
jgi:predicted transcriptional regulator